MASAIAQRHVRDGREIPSVLDLPDDSSPVMGVHMRRQAHGTLVRTQGPNNAGMNSRPQHAASNTHRRVNSTIARAAKSTAGFLHDGAPAKARKSREPILQRWRARTVG
jgi:hypothetical protein